MLEASISLPELNDEWLISDSDDPHNPLDLSARREAVQEIIAGRTRARRRSMLCLLLVTPILVTTAIAILGKAIR